MPKYKNKSIFLDKRMYAVILGTGGSPAGIWTLVTGGVFGHDLDPQASPEVLQPGRTWRLATWWDLQM